MLLLMLCLCSYDMGGNKKGERTSTKYLGLMVLVDPNLVIQVSLKTLNVFLYRLRFSVLLITYTKAYMYLLFHTEHSIWGKQQRHLLLITVILILIFNRSQTPLLQMCLNSFNMSGKMSSGPCVLWVEVRQMPFFCRAFNVQRSWQLPFRTV